MMTLPQARQQTIGCTPAIVCRKGGVWFPPVSPEAFEVVPECASDDNKDEIAFNVFKLPAISIVMESFTCPPPGLAEHYDLAGEQAEAEFCEARCLETAECNFLWHGEQEAPRFADCTGIAETSRQRLAFQES